jgi:DNA polymerase I-like protein with 3'-5' exonuclease and polymerase domains
VWGDFTLIEWEEFNPDSSKQVRERMDEFGWKPEEMTKPSKTFPDGQPKVSEANLNTLPDTAPGEAKFITEYLKLSTRIELMENWIANYNPATKSVHGRIIHIGAITHRCAHRDPNTANIPGNDEWNIRECWGLPSDSEYRLVGVDAKGIQLRILAHLTNSEEFKQVVLHGDPHTEFTAPIVAKFFPELVAWTTEEEKHEVKQKKTKRFIYAWLLGAGFKKVGVIFGTSKENGKVISEGFVNEFPGLAELKEYLADCAAKGWFPAPDGRYAPIKSEHYALSVALQCIEATLMKLAMILWKREVDRLQLEARYAAFVHDEVQIIAHHSAAEQAGQIMIASIIKAGQMLKLRCPMDGDMNIGYNWSQTH